MPPTPIPNGGHCRQNLTFVYCLSFVYLALLAFIALKMASKIVPKKRWEPSFWMGAILFGGGVI
jgi:hypothetical protein